MEEKKHTPSPASSLSLPILARQTAWLSDASASRVDGPFGARFTNAVELLQDAIDALQDVCEALRNGRDVGPVNGSVADGSQPDDDGCDEEECEEEDDPFETDA